MKKTRRDPSMPTPETAEEIEALSASYGHTFLSLGKKNRHKEESRKIKRSAMLAITKRDLDIAKERRGTRGIKIKNLKMVHQMFYKNVDGKGQVGTRTIRCVCDKCFERNFGECVARKWTGGEPTWHNCD